MINLIEKNFARKQYKLEKAGNYIIACKEQNMIKPTLEYLIAEQKVMNETIPGMYEASKEFFKIKKALYYYRKKYNNEGITKIFERFTKSKPFINAHNTMVRMTLKEIQKILKKAK